LLALIDQHSPDTAAHRSRAVIVSLFALALLPLFVTPVLPFIDFYNHVARYYVLSHLDATTAFAANYAPRWAILPNVGLDVLASLAMRVLPPSIVPHLIVVALFATLYSGVLAFNRALGGRSSALVALLILPLLYSFILNWGFANFLLGMGMMFWALAWWLNQRLRLARALPVACVLALAIFFIHGLAFALYGIMLGCLELGLFLASSNRRPSRLLAMMPALAAQAVMPVLLFLAAPTSKNPEGFTNADESIAKLQKVGALSGRLIDLATYRLTTIIRVAEGPSYAFDLLSCVAMVLILILMINRGMIRIMPALWPALLVATLLVIVCPPALLGVGYVADRMPLLLALVFVAGIAARPHDVGAQQSRFETSLIAAAGLLIAVRLAAIGLAWAPYAQDEADFRRVAAVLSPGHIIESVWPNDGRLDSGRRCQMFPPRLVSEFRHVGRLFANATQQPLDITGRLKTAIDNGVSRDSASRQQPFHLDRVIAGAVPAGFDAVLVCDGDRLERPYPGSLKVAAQSGRFTLLVPR
jgi:hypothetical protein